MHTHPGFILIAALFVGGACTLDPKNLSDPGDDSNSDTGPDPTAITGETGSDSGVTDAPDPGSESGTTATDDTGETGSDSGVTDATDPGSESGTTATDDTGEPASCDQLEPTASAAYKLALDGWPEQSDEDHTIEAGCTIDSVSSDGVTVTTALTCDDGGVPRGASLAIAAAPEGAVDWAAGLAVTLRSNVFEDESLGENELSMSLTADPAALLVHGQDWWGDNVPAKQEFGPIVREIAETCVLDFEDKRFLLRYSLTADASVSVMSGSRAVLPIDDGHVYAIDLAHSGEDCCHGSEHSLIRRVTTD